MCNLLASERRERERRLSCCGRRHRRSRTDGRTDGETGEIPATNAFPLSAHLQVLHATIPRSSLSSPQCCPKLVNRCKLGRRSVGQRRVYRMGEKGGMERRGRRRWWSWNVWSKAGRRRRRREIEEESVDRPRKEGIIERRAMARRRHICFVIDQTKGKRLRFRTITRRPLIDRATQIGAVLCLYTGDSEPPPITRTGEEEANFLVPCEFGPKPRGRF